MTPKTVIELKAEAYDIVKHIQINQQHQQQLQMELAKKNEEIAQAETAEDSAGAPKE